MPMGACPDASTLTIELGTRQSAESIAGDARLHVISLDPIASDQKPTPIECFLLAGYLGFQVLAALADVPAERAEYARRSSRIEYGVQELLAKLRRPDGFTFVGMGQVGQAFPHSSGSGFEVTSARALSRSSTMTSSSRKMGAPRSCLSR